MSEEEITHVAKEVFGITKFRSFQLEVIKTCLSKPTKDIFLQMQTGGGKSLCYQLPALIEQGITVVISPLISLINDQVASMKQLGINVVCWTSQMNMEDIQNILEQLTNLTKKTIQDGQRVQQGIRLIYTTPESITRSIKFKGILCKLYTCNMLARFVIDEVHCVSQWGHDFRPTYKELSMLKDEFPKTPIFAVTATATDRVKKDVIDILKIHDCVKFCGPIDRPNLRFEVRQKTKNTINDIIEWILKNYLNQSGIIYCLSKKECETVVEQLRMKNIKADFYHADRSDKERQEVQKLWTNDRIHVIVATIAFGMGIDKPDVRFVIHYSLPKSIESYYQEVGRAGRDGLLSDCILYYSYQDKIKLEYLIRSAEPNEFSFSYRNAKHNLNLMIDYCEDVESCRREIISKHFGEQYDRKKCKKTCDNCKHLDKCHTIDVTYQAIELLSIIDSIQTKHPLTYYISIWCGENIKRIQERGHDKVQCFGYFRKENKSRAINIGKKLIRMGVLKEEYFNNQFGLQMCVTINYEKAIQVNDQKLKVILTERSQSNDVAFDYIPSSELLDLPEPSIERDEKKNEEELLLFVDDKAKRGLYNLIYKFRIDIANERDCLPYEVFSQRAMDYLSSKMPITLNQLMLTPELDPSIIKSYGIELLKIIRVYRNQIIGDCEAKLSEKEEEELKFILFDSPTKNGNKRKLSSENQETKSKRKRVKVKRKIKKEEKATINKCTKLLGTIFDFLPLKDKIQTIPLVCKTWKNAQWNYLITEKEILDDDSFGIILSNHKNITHLELQDCRFLSSLSVGRIVSLISTRLVSLNLSQCSQFTSNDIGRLAVAIQQSPTIQYLKFKGIKAMGDDGIGCIAYVLRNDKNVKSLSLEQCNISALGALSLSDMLKSNQSLKYLHLKDNCINDEGACHIAEALKQNQTLISLHLYRNGINDKGGIAIGESLLHNKTLRSLKLSYNKGIGDLTMQAFQKTLLTNTSLTDLHFYGCSITKNGLVGIQEVLSANSTLKELNLGSNQLGDEGVEILSKGLYQNKSLRKLNLFKNSITDKSLNTLLELLNFNTSLVDVKLFGRRLNYRKLLQLERKLENNLFKKLWLNG